MEYFSLGNTCFKYKLVNPDFFGIFYSNKMEITKEHKQWLIDFNLNHPLVIAGPCSAETEEQVLKIAHE